MRAVLEIIPGLALAVGVSALGFLGERFEALIWGEVWLDGLVLAIIFGTLLHTGIALSKRYKRGIGFSSKTLLEIAIVLLGGTISASTILSTGPTLVLSVMVVVAVSLTVSYAIGRAVGLSDTLATLVSCGNSICGNSAIAAAAPVLDATSEDVASSIAFTAVLGVVVVLLLPVAFKFLGVTEFQYGVVAGLTVYAVPQVLAATIPVGIVSTQIGTIVKLVRVLMLGPVVLILGLKSGRQGAAKLKPSHLVPWFIAGFLLMMAARSFDLVPLSAVAPLKDVSTALTIVSMAGLGLSVDVRSVLSSGGRVLAAGCLSIAMLLCLALTVVEVLPVA
jgi:uncharacterized integral membrane protein (TIGR00698 family)